MRSNFKESIITIIMSKKLQHNICKERIVEKKEAFSVKGTRMNCLSSLGKTKRLNDNFNMKELSNKGLVLKKNEFK